MVQESNKHLKIIYLYHLLLLIYFKSNAQCVNSSNITLQFGTNTFVGELCIGGLNISANTCPAYQNLPSGTLISPGYSALNRNRTNTMIDYSNVHLIFEDNFDGSTIDENKWDLHTDYQPGGYGFYHSIGMEYFSLPGDVTVSSGSAHLWAKYHSTAFTRRSVDWMQDSDVLNDNVTNLRNWHYSSGYLFSQQYFKHGVFEIRAKIPDITNVWPALWLYGAPGEIDLLEMTRNGLESTTQSNNTMYFTYHCTDYPISPLTCEGTMTAGRRLINLATAAGNFNNFANTWHTFKLVWSENMMQWVIDNQVIFTEYQYYASQDGNLMFPMANGTTIQAFETAGFGIYYNRAFPQRQMKLILSQGIINSNTQVKPSGQVVPAVYPNQGATDLGSLPKEFEIDYVKVYALNSCASDIYYCNENTRLRDLPSYIHGANVTIGGDGCHDVVERESEVHEERYYKRNVEVKASNSIHLKSGFHVAEKALFHASIEPCINNQRIAPEPIPEPINIISLGLSQVGDVLVGSSSNTNSNLELIKSNSLNNKTDSDSSRLKNNQTKNTFNVFPSPANDQINIQFVLNHIGDIDISIFDMNGKLVGNLYKKQNIEPNNYNISFDAKILSSGIYYVKFLTLQETKILKLIVTHD